jgi:hypothetical protein
VLRIISGFDDSINTSSKFPFFLKLWKLMFNMRMFLLVYFDGTHYLFWWFSGTWYTIEDELFCLEHVHFSSLLPMSSSSVVIPRHDLWIHLSQSSQAITFVLHALSQMPQGNRGRLGPGFGSMPDNRSSTRWWQSVPFTVNNMHWVCCLL